MYVCTMEQRYSNVVEGEAKRKAFNRVADHN